ncbi:MAG TPA: M28 family metallopeptidase [Bryobacteraceae bacterium]|nr:M28 family metallopeptidase [Bryobacteraceae bacterium]
MRKIALAAAGIFLFGLASCTTFNPEGRMQNAMNAISPVSLLAEIKTLSSDDFEGRKPGTEGGKKAVAYMEDQFKKLGLKPGNPNKTYRQDVPLAGIISNPAAQFAVNGHALPAQFKKDFIAVSQHYAPHVDVKDSDIVFVGYGVSAPEYDWDDYKGVDVKGKTLLMLVNDPQIPDPNDPTKLDDSMFKGRAMTYYGRWTYKYEIAAQKGAAAVMIIHETNMAGYSFSVVVDSWGGENFTIDDANNEKTVPVQGWFTYDKAAELCKAAGLDLAALKANALQKDFKPVTLPGAKATFHIENTLRKIQSQNVVAKLEGSDPARNNEYVIYTAHWDHLGRDPSLPGDQIYNGAVDNASGSAGLIEIARAYTKLFPRPKRSILFLSVTAEEQGLLGAEYYAEHPLYPLKYTLADINMDGLNVWGRTRDMVLIGLGNSDLDDIATDVLKSHGRTVKGDAEPEKGFFYRSDHFEFAKEGVPALDPDQGVDYIGKPAEYGKQKRDYYTEHDYHKPSDEVKPDWDLSGAVEDLQVFFEIGNRVADGEYYPLWKPGTEFKARRDEMMKSNK